MSETERIAELEREAFRWLKLLPLATSRTQAAYYRRQAGAATKEAKRLSTLPQEKTDV